MIFVLVLLIYFFIIYFFVLNCRFCEQVAGTQCYTVRGLGVNCASFRFVTAFWSLEEMM